MELSQPAIVLPRQQFVAADSGVGAHDEDAFFADAKNELSDKGFLVAAADNLFAWARAARSR
jgi:hypothetical protein